MTRTRTVAPAPARGLPRKARMFLEHVAHVAADLRNRHFAEMYQESVRRLLVEGDPHLFDFLSVLDREPVGIEEFIESAEFLGSSDINVWPEVKQSAREIYGRWWAGVDHGAYDECVFSGATGTAKSTLAIIVSLYTVYLLSCMRNPQQWYGLPSATTIVLGIFAAKPRVMHKVIYLPMRKFLEGMPYFQKHMMPDKNVESEMYFPEKNLRVIPAGQDENAVLGEALIAAIVDEANFMNVVARSKKIEVTAGRAGVYDQAAQLHSTIMRRKKSRFLRPGPMIGQIICASSTRYKGDFTDKREEEVTSRAGSTCYIYRRRQFDVQPQERYSGRKFRFLVGNDLQYASRPLTDGEPVPPGAHVEMIPIEYLPEFTDNPHDAMRDVLGISNNVLSPFFKLGYKITDCVDIARQAGLQSFLVKDNVILGQDGMPQVVEGHYCLNPSKPRFVHVDVGLTGDRAGIAMCSLEGMVKVDRGDGTYETLPVVRVEMACSIEPDQGHEIMLADIRNFIVRLKTKHGYPIKSVTYDSFQSRDSVQMFRKMRISSKELSVDRTDAPYIQLRDAIYDGRVLLPDNELLFEELVGLEHDAQKKKVDHRPRASKDLADAVCGAVANLLDRRSTWADQGGGEDDRDDMQDRLDDTNERG